MAIQISGTTVIDNSRNLTNIASIFSCTGIASQAEAEAGTSSTTLMTPQRVAQAIAALGGNVINRIQRGSTNTGGPLYVPSSAIAPIISVNTSKSFISQGQRMDHGGQPGNGNQTTSIYISAASASVSARLNSATEVLVARGGRGGAPNGLGLSGTVDWEVIEFK